MDIKIISNEDGAVCYPLNRDKVLMIKSVQGSGLGGSGVIPFPRVDYYIYHVKADVKEEILSDIEKYMVSSMYFCEKENSEIYFFHIEYTKFPVATLILFSYNITQQVCKEVYRFEDNLRLYEKEKQMDLFILNSNYFLLQIRQLTGNNRNNYRGYLKFESFLYDRNNRMKFEIADERITKYGISQMEPIATNVCAIRLGYSLIEEDRYQYLIKREASEECIGLISISQFIADIILKIPIVSMEIIDEVYWDKTFLPIIKQGKYVIFSRISRGSLAQEIFFYQYITKETMMLLNKSGYDETKKLFPCVLCKTPYIVKERKKYIEFYNITKNRVDLKLPVGTQIVGIQNDYLVLKLKRGNLFSAKKEDTFEIYQFSNMKMVYRERAEKLQCLSTGTDNLLVFTEGSV